MVSEQDTSAIGNALVVLGAAGIVIPAFARFRISPVIGFILVGLLVGPSGLGALAADYPWLRHITIASSEDIALFGEFGIILLLFSIGLELSFRRLWQLRKLVFGIGAAELLLGGAILGTALFLLGDHSTAAAYGLGIALALSSTALVLPIAGTKSAVGRASFAMLLFEDLAIVPMITIIAALSRAPADPSAPPGTLLALYTLLAIAGLVLAGRFVVNPLLRLVARYGERELFVVVGLLVVLASSALMHSLHVSTALGAFVAGVMLADSPYRHEIEADVEPFRLILLGLFFLAVGMVLDVNVILADPLRVLLLAAGLVAVKVVVLTLLVRAFGKSWKTALGLALLLSQGGEFGFLLFTQAADALLIAPEAASLFSAVVTLSMVSTPFLMLFARNLEFSPDRDGDELEGPDDAPRGSALVIGYGRFGQIVAQMLHAVDCSVTLIDKKPSQIELSGRFDTKVYFGDGLRLDLLRRAGAEEARVIIYCIDDATVDAEVLRPIVEAFPQAKILTRVFDRRQLMAIEGAGTGGAVREVFESSIALGLMALEKLDVDPRQMEDVEAALRQLDATRLAAQMDEGDLAAGKDHRFKPGGGRESASVLEKLRQRRQEAKAAARDEEAMQAADPESA